MREATREALRCGLRGLRRLVTPLVARTALLAAIVLWGPVPAGLDLLGSAGPLAGPELEGVALGGAALEGAPFGASRVHAAEVRVLTLYSAVPQSGPSPAPPAFRLRGDAVAAAAAALKAAVEERFPHVTLTFVEPQVIENPVSAETVALELVTGGYDLVFSDLMASLIPHDVLTPLEHFLERDPIRYSSLFESLVRQMTWQGRLYDLPVAVDPYVLLYVPLLFDAVGVAYPDAQWTWSDFSRAAERLYFSEDPGFFSFFSRMSFEVQTPLFGARVHPGSLLPILLAQTNSTGLEEADEPLARALSLLMELQRNPGVFWTISESPDSLALGRAAMEPAYLGQGMRHAVSYTAWYPQTVNQRTTWVPRRFPGAPAPFAWGIAPVPAFEGGERVSEAAVLSVAIPANSPNRAEAWQVARFIAGPDGAAILARMGLLPAFLDEETMGLWLQALRAWGSEPPDTLTVVSTLNLTVAGRRRGVAEFRFRAEYPARIAGLFEGRYWLFDALDIAREVRAEIAALGL